VILLVVDGAQSRHEHSN